MMLCPQQMLCDVVSFSTGNHQWSHTENSQSHTKGTNLSFIPSRDFFVCWCWPGFAFSTHPIHKNKSNKKKGRGWKGQSPADHWSMTQLLKSLTSNQIVQLQGAEVPQSCPRPHNVTNQLWGVNAHFSQLSRTCDGGKGKQRSTEVTTLTISRVFQILNCVIKEAGNSSFLNPNTSNLTFSVFIRACLDLNTPTTC